MFGASQSVVSRRRLKGFDESVGAAVRIGSVHSEDMQWGQARRGGGTGGSIGGCSCEGLDLGQGGEGEVISACIISKGALMQATVLSLRVTMKTRASVGAFKNDFSSHPAHYTIYCCRPEFLTQPLVCMHACTNAHMHTRTAVTGCVSV